MAECGQTTLLRSRSQRPSAPWESALTPLESSVLALVTQLSIEAGTWIGLANCHGPSTPARSLYEASVARYQEVGEFLNSVDSSLRYFRPKIYPQGSFRLGTMIRPWLREDEYDIDLVCLLNLAKTQITQANLKAIVGARLAENP